MDFGLTADPGREKTHSLYMHVIPSIFRWQNFDQLEIYHLLWNHVLYFGLRVNVHIFPYFSLSIPLFFVGNPCRFSRQTDEKFWSSWMEVLIKNAIHKKNQEKSAWQNNRDTVLE